MRQSERRAGRQRSTRGQGRRDAATRLFGNKQLRWRAGQATNTNTQRHRRRARNQQKTWRSGGGGEENVGRDAPRISAARVGRREEAGGAARSRAWEQPQTRAEEGEEWQKRSCGCDNGSTTTDDALSHSSGGAEASAAATAALRTAQPNPVVWWAAATSAPNTVLVSSCCFEGGTTNAAADSDPC